jgi:hypothetical protein
MSNRDPMQVARWCLEIQIQRVRHLLAREKDQQKLMSNGWREIFALLTINDQIRKSEAEVPRVSSHPIDGTQEREPKNGANNLFSSLDHIDRDLIREAIKELTKASEQRTPEENDDNV